MKHRGFTLIELLVVIAIIALLLSVVMPGLNMAKKKAASAVCLSNTRQMSIGWYMYQEESDGKIMSALMENVGSATECKEAWIAQPFAESDTTTSSLTLAQISGVTDADEIRGITKGKLYPYLENSDVYHCTGDKLRKRPDGTRMYVSYSISFCLYGRNKTLYSASAYPQIEKFTEITSPATRYIFVESGQTYRNWNAGGQWVMAAPEYGHAGYGLHTPVAISHGNSSVFGFTDGHSEVKKWHDDVIFEHYRKMENAPVGSSYGALMDSDSEDLQWLAGGWAYRYKQ
jgi:prepilin-type N-terminal cleavage/methylation domain-containing protein